MVPKLPLIRLSWPQAGVIRDTRESHHTQQMDQIPCWTTHIIATKTGDILVKPLLRNKLSTVVPFYVEENPSSYLFLNLC